MPVSSTHPDYRDRENDWAITRDTVEGDTAIRRSVTKYLPPPPGLVEGVVQGDGSRLPHGRYSFYASFAEFPEIVSPTLNGILGLIHEKQPKVELPPDMEYLIKSASPDGETLEEIWERITKEILITGRQPILIELFGDKPYLCPYPAENLINWMLRPKREGGGPAMAVFKEITREPMNDDPFEYEDVTRYRVIRLENGTYTVSVYEEIENEFRKVVDSDGLVDVVPLLYGKSFDMLPVVVVNTLDCGFEFGPIPLLPMARRALSIFRKTADYNRSLYMKGDPQPIIFGIDPEDAPDMIGSGTIWTFENSDAKAQYLDIDGMGIPLMRESINDEFDRFSDEVGTLFEGVTSGYESGEALRRRQAMRQVTIKSLVINAAQGVEQSLRLIGRMMGKSEAELEAISFQPNIDFTEPMMTGQELQNLIQARNLGAPMSEKSLHALMKRRQLTLLDYEEEQDELKKVPVVLPEPAGGINPPPADKSVGGIPEE